MLTAAEYRNRPPLAARSSTCPDSLHMGTDSSQSRLLAAAALMDLKVASADGHRSDIRRVARISADQHQGVAGVTIENVQIEHVGSVAGFGIINGTSPE